MVLIILILSPISVSAKSTKQYLGKYRITYYCPCRKCNGSYANATASGKKPKAKHTIAVDPKVIPLGSKIKIGNTIYVAEDTGVKGKTIDIFVSSHSKALRYGVKHKKVYLIKNKKKK